MCDQFSNFSFWPDCYFVRTLILNAMLIYLIYYLIAVQNYRTSHLFFLRAALHLHGKGSCDSYQFSSEALLQGAFARAHPKVQSNPMCAAMSNAR